MKSRLVVDILANITDFENKINQTTSMVDGMKNQLKTYSESSGNSLWQVGDSWMKAGRHIDTAGTALTKFVSVPLAGILAPSIAAAVSYEDAFAEVRKTVDATESQFDSLNKAIREMSKEIPASTEELAAIMGLAGQMGIAVDSLEEFTEVAIGLGVATNLSAEDAALNLARLANVMGLADDSYSRMGSTMVSLGNNFATTESEILNMTMRLAGAGKVAGYSTADIMGISTALTSVGITAEAGGTSMSKLMSSMQVAGTVGVDEMRKIEEATGETYETLYLMSQNSPREFKALADSIGLPKNELQKVVQAGWDLSKMSKVAGYDMEEFAHIVANEPTKAMNDFILGLFDTDRLGKDAIAMLGEMGITQERVRDNVLRAGGAQELFNTAIEDANRAWDENVALQDEVSERYETTHSHLKIAWNAIKDIGVAIGNALLPTIKEFSDWLVNLSNSITSMDPETLEKIVKALGAVALIGPGLVIAGKGISAIGGALKVISGLQGAIKVFQSMRNVGTIIPEFADGGWTKDIVQNAGYTIDDVGWIKNLKGQFVSRDLQAEMAKINAGLKPGEMIDLTDTGLVGGLSKTTDKINEMGRAFLDLPGKMSGAIKEKGLFTASLDGLRGAGTKLTSSSLFKAGLWAALAGYLIHTYKSSAEFRAGLDRVKDGLSFLLTPLKLLGDAIKGLFTFIADVTGGFLNLNGIMSDLLVIGGGALTLFLGFSNPLGWAAIAVGTLTGAFKLLGAESAQTAFEQEKFNSVIGDVADHMSSAEHTFTAFSREHLPELRKSLDEVYSIAEGGEIEFVSHESLEDQKEAIATMSEDVMAYLSEYWTNLELQQSIFRQREGLLEDEHHQSMSQLLAKNAQTELEKAQEKLDRLAEIDELERLGAAELTDDLIAERARLIEEIEALVNKQAVAEEEKRTIEMDAIRRHYQSTGELTEEQQNRLNEIIMEKYKQRNSDLLDNTQLEIETIKTALKEGNITQEEFNAKEEKIMQKHYDTLMVQAEEHINEYLVQLAGMTQAEAEEYVELRKLQEGERDHMYNKDTEYAELFRESIKGMTLDQRTEAHIQRRDRVEDYEKRLKDTGKFLKDMEILPEELTKLVSDSKGKWNFGFLSEEIDRVRVDVKKSAEETGKAASDGLEKGIDMNKVWGLGMRMGNNIRLSMNQALEVKSPSRVMKRIGGFVTEGLAIGMEESQHEVDEASKALAKAAMIDDISSSYDMGIQRVVATKYSLDYETKLANTIAKTVSEEVSKRPIKAYIGEEELQEEVLYTVERDLWRAG